MIVKRPEWELFVPVVLMALAAGLHFYGMVAVMCWTGLGYLALAATGKRSVSSYGRGPEWRSGWRKFVVVSYNLFWWPWIICR